MTQPAVPLDLHQFIRAMRNDPATPPHLAAEAARILIDLAGRREVDPAAAWVIDIICVWPRDPGKHLQVVWQGLPRANPLQD